MYIYIVVESNRETRFNDDVLEYSENVGGVYSSLEKARQHKPRYETGIERIEQWELNGVYVGTVK